MKATALESVVRHTIRPLWTPIPHIAGPAFTVRTARHDNLMLRARVESTLRARGYLT